MRLKEAVTIFHRDRSRRGVMESLALEAHLIFTWCASSGGPNK